MDLTEIKLKLPIEKLGEALGIKLETTSAKYATALCPFHHDTTPSFTFDRFSQTCRCFSSSCSDIGRMDHVALIMRHEQLPREMAVDRLYQLAGEDRPISSLHEILGRALSRLMANVEMPDPASFFKSRGISAAVLREMQVGYSPDFTWFKETMSDLPMEEAAKLEFFRMEMFDDAIIYPLFDGLGRPAGFQSRSMGAAFNKKYINNNRDFPLKPSRIYGQHSIKNRQMVLVEGVNDVLAMRSAGFKNVGGLMGLNLRDVGEYLSESGYSDIVLLADGDAAGEQAIMKAPNLIRVTQVPNGMDPDEFLAGKGIAGLTEMGELINGAKYPFESKLESRLLRASTETLTGKIMLIKAIAKDMSEGLPAIIVRKLRDRIAEVLQIPKEEVETIFELVDHDTSDLEEKIIWHVFENGEYSPDITAKVLPHSISNVRQRKAYQEMIEGLSATEQPIKREGLTKGDLDKFIEITNRRYIKKVLSGATTSILNLAEPLDEVMSNVMSKIATVVIEDIQVVNSAQQLDLGIQNAIERSKNPNKLLGISFGEGFTKMDSVLQGLRPNSTYILAAKQGSGKSALGMDWAINMAFHQKVPTLWISLEMSELDMSIRLLSKLTGIAATPIMTGGISPSDIPTLCQQAIKHGGAPFYVANCGVLSINQIIALVRKYKIKHDIQAVFIDYIQLIDSGVRLNSMYERVGHISRMIKSGITMDRSIALPVVAIAQLNRAAAKHDTPTSEDIGESYKISQDADVVMLLRQRSEAEMEKDKLTPGKNFGNAILNIDKNRAGLDKIVCPLIFNKENLRFREVLQ